MMTWYCRECGTDYEGEVPVNNICQSCQAAREACEACGGLGWLDIGDCEAGVIETCTVCDGVGFSTNA